MGNGAAFALCLSMNTGSDASFDTTWQKFMGCESCFWLSLDVVVVLVVVVAILVTFRGAKQAAPPSLGKCFALAFSAAVTGCASDLNLWLSSNVASCESVNSPLPWVFAFLEHKTWWDLLGTLHVETIRFNALALHTTQSCSASNAMSPRSVCCCPFLL